MIKKFESVHMILEVYDNRVAITPKGSGFFSPRGFSGKKEIPLSSIKAIQFKEAGFLNAGFIQFTIHGGRDAGGGLLNAVKDENSFLFGVELNEQMKELKDLLMSKVIDIERDTRLTPMLSLADEISKLKALNSEGLITNEQFEELKKKIIEGI